jgi:hypothetical protein
VRIPHSPDQVLVKMGRGAATSQTQCHFEAWQGSVRLQIQCRDGPSTGPSPVVFLQPVSVPIIARTARRPGLSDFFKAPNRGGIA